MALSRQYSLDFERVWKVYPKRPPRRSVKEVSYKAWQSANKLLKFTPADVDAIVSDIEQRSRSDVDWIKEHGKFIPALSVYINQHRWNEPWTRARQSYQPTPIQREPVVVVDKAEIKRRLDEVTRRLRS